MEDFWGAAWTYAMAICVAFVGRGLALAAQRPRLVLNMLWEIPQAAGMGIIGLGMAGWLGLHGQQAAALIVVVAYLGPAQVVPIARSLLKRGGRGG